MIETAQENLKNYNFDKEFIYADFSGEKFRNEFPKLVPKNNKKIVGLLGGTIGNVPQNYIVNTLRNTLSKGDILLFNCRAQMEDTDLNANIYFKKYLRNLQDKEELKFLEYPLKNLGIPTNIGQFNLEMTKEKPINCLIFTFGFKIEKDFEFKINEDSFTLLKDDYITLFRIRVYNYNYLKTFFEKRNFKEINKKISGERLNIVFEKQ